MSKTSIQQLTGIGQSVWLDNINSGLITSGKLKNLIEQGLAGITSNPTIFEKAISSGGDYNKKIEELHSLGKSTFEIYDDLTVTDIQEAADILFEVYKNTKGLDGYVSLEIDPRLAYNKDETIKEALRLSKKVNRANLMLKVPATGEGFYAIEELTARGLSVNATLVFSLKQYANTASAYLRGIKRFLKNNPDAGKIRSVASCFVSRIDTAVDKMLDELILKEKNTAGQERVIALKGKAAVINCGRIYNNYVNIFSSREFMDLWDKRANIQRVLWASTSTKNPAYSDIKYVSELIAKNTVNTLPEETLYAFLGHGKPSFSLPMDAASVNSVVKELSGLGIDLDAVCEKLLKDGLAAFEKSFNSLLSTIEGKSKELCVR